MTTYKSINGFTVNLVEGETTKIYPKNLLQFFTCCVTLETIKVPVVLDSGLIYDYMSLKQWFMSSDIEPLTGQSRSLSQTKYYPAYTFFTMMLLLEETPDGLKYHIPMSNLHHLLDIGKIYYDLVKHKSPIKYTQDRSLKDDVMYLIDPKRNDQMYAVQLEQFLMCPLSGKSMMNNMIMYEQGYFVHNQISTIKSPDYSGNYILTGKYNYIVGRSLIKIGCLNGLCQSLGMAPFVSPFNVIVRDHNSIQPPPTMMFQDIYNMSDIIDLDTIKQPEQPSYECEKHTTEELIDDFYMSLTSSGMATKQLFLQKIGPEFHRLRERTCVTDFAATYPTESHPKNHSIIQYKELLGVPFVYSGYMDQIYGLDLSGLKLKNVVKSNVYLKGYYFVGSKLEECTFDNCEFLCCKFILTEFRHTCFTGKCTFKECWFLDISGDIKNLFGPHNTGDNASVTRINACLFPKNST